MIQKHSEIESFFDFLNFKTFIKNLSNFFETIDSEGILLVSDQRPATAFTDLDNDQFKKAADANGKGLSKGGVKRPDQCHLVKGMAHFNLKQYSAARKAFLAAGGVEVRT